MPSDEWSSETLHMHCTDFHLYLFIFKSVEGFQLLKNLKLKIKLNLYQFFAHSVNLTL